MADDIDKKRKSDAGIIDEADFGELDNINLDFPPMGDEGLEFGKGRKPSSPKKQFAVEAAKGLGGGVLGATKTQLRRAMPSVGAVVDEAGAAIDDFKQLKDDLSRQLAPITNSVENATRKLLPKVESYLPKKIYQKIANKLEERAAIRGSGVSSGPSKEQREAEEIRNEIAQLFGAQMEAAVTDIRERKKDIMVDRALGSMRHRQQTTQLIHVYDAVRATELFHKTQHVAYMKKSLELKYKHIFIARDTFNLLQQSMRTFEGYYKGILANTALPDMMKAQARDFIKKSRTERFGNAMAGALSNIRGQIFKKISSKANEVLGNASMFSSMLETMAGMSEMADGMGGPKKSAAGTIGGLLGKGIGYFGGGALTRKLFGNGENGQMGLLTPYLGGINNSVKGMRANMGIKLSEMQQKMAASTNPILNMISDFLPNALAKQETASNDMFSKAEEAAPFDVITRQSIVEVIPSYLGKIWHEVAMLRTGDETLEEKTYNVFQRKFTGVSEMKSDMSDYMFGTKEERGRMFADTMAKVQAGVGLNRGEKYESYKEKFKRFSKDFDRIFNNIAIQSKSFKPKIIQEFVTSSGKNCSDPGYINEIMRGVEHDWIEVLEVLAASMFTEDGTPDDNTINIISAAITENVRKHDQWKERAAKMSETFGANQLMSSDLSRKELASLKKAAMQNTAEGRTAKRRLDTEGGIINRFGAEGKINLGGIAASRVGDIDYSEEGNVDSDMNRLAQSTRKSTFSAGLKQRAAFAKMMEAGNYDQIEKYLGKGKGFFSKVGRMFDPTYIPGLEEEKASVEDESGLTKEERIARAAKRSGIIYDKNAIDILAKAKKAYSDSEAANKDLSAEFRGMQARNAYDDVFNSVYASVVGADKSGEYEAEQKAKEKMSWKSGARSMLDAFRGKKTDTEESKTTSSSVKSFLSDAVKATKDGFLATRDKLSSTDSIKKFRTVVSNAKKNASKLKDEFNKTPAGKKTAEVLAYVENLCDQALKGGKEKLEALRQTGALEDPAAFMRYVKTQAGESVDDLTEDLPPMSDTEAWKKLASSKFDALKGAAATGWSSVKTGVSGVVGSVAGAFSGTGSAGTSAPSGASQIPSSTVGTEGPTLHTSMPEPEERETVEASSSQIERIIEEMQGWRKEAVENQGTIFDAVAQIDETLKNMKGGISVGGGNLNEEELAKQLGKDIRKHSLVRKGLHAAKEGIAGTVKGVGKVYTRIYGAALKGAGTAMKGIGFAAGKAIDNIGKGARSVGKWLTHKEDYVDVYVKGKEGGMPLVSARKQRDPDEGIFYKSSGKRVKKSADIDEPCVDKNGNLVITAEDLKAGLVMHNSSPIGKMGAGLLSLGKSYFGLYGKALESIGGVVKTSLKILFGNAVDRYVDVYRKDEIAKGPLLTARKQEEEGVYFFESGKKVKRSSDIHEPICDRDKKMLITKEDIEHGLVNVNNKPLGTGGHGGVVGAVAALAIPAIKGAGKIAGKLLKEGAGIYGTAYRKAIELGAGALKGTGKFIGRALGLDVGGIGSGADPEMKSAIIGQYGLLKQIQADVALIANPYRPEGNPLDKDGDGDIDGSPADKFQRAEAKRKAEEEKKAKLEAARDADGDGDVDGSYADQMSKKKGDAERIKAEDVHKDVHWGEDKDEKEGGGGKGKDDGGSIFDMLGKLIPKKYRRRLGALKRLYSKKALSFAKNAGNWLLKGGKSILGKAGGLLKMALPHVTKALGGVGKGLLSAGKFVGAKAMPLLGKAGGLAAKVGGSIATKVGAPLAAKFAAAGGIKGLGSMLLNPAMLTNPVTLGIAGALAAGYGIYRGVKGFSKENALKNVGQSKGISRESQLTFEDRMASALGMNTKIGAKLVGGAMSINPLVGLLKGIRGNDNPLNDKEIEKGRAKLQNKIKKGLPGYDRILQEYEKAIDAGNWKRARQLTGQEADGIIKSMWKHSITGKVVGGLGNLIFGNKDKEMTEEEIKKTRDKFQSLMKHGGNKAKNAEKLLNKFDDYVAEQDWKNARKIAGMEQRGLFGKLFQDSKGNMKWGKLAATALGGVVGLGISTLLDPSKDPNKPMDEKEIKEAQAWFQKQIDAGSKPAQKLLDQFNEAVTEQNWKKARKLCGKEVRSNLSKTLGLMGKAAKFGLRSSAALMTGGMSEVLLGFMGDQDTPMKDDEIKKFRDKMNYMISKGDKLAERKLEKFEEYVGRQQWEKARKIAKMPHKGWAMRATKAVSSFFFGDDEKEMTEQEIQKFRDSMNRKMDIGGKVGKMAQRKLEAFDDAVGRQNWKKARILAQNPNDGLVQSVGKAVGKAAMNVGRFFFGGDGKPMSESEIEQARKKLNWAIAENRPKAQKRLDYFEDLIADEKWEKARKLVKMPYENVVKRIGKAVGGFLFGSDKDALTPEEIEKFQNECDQRIADGETKYTKILAAFNSAVEVENWAKARKISKIKAEGVVQKVGKALNPLNWFKDSYEDCQKIKEEIEEKAMDDETGIVQQGLEEFEKLVRRRKYKEAMKLGKDLKKMKPSELSKKHGFKSEKLEEYSKRANDLQVELAKRISAEKGFFSMKRFRLKGLKSDLMSDPSNWSDEFFEDIEDRMNEICGTGEYAEEEPDDQSVFKGNQLINDIDKTADKFSWFGSPIIKSKLKMLKGKVKSSMTEWDEDTISEWREELKEITGKEAEDSSSKEQPDEAIMKDANTLLKDIAKTKDDLNPFNIIGKSQLNGLKSEIESDVTAWTPENIEHWRSRLREIGGNKAADSREIDNDIEEKAKTLLSDIDKTKEKMGFFDVLDKVRLNKLKNEIESDPHAWSKETLDKWRKQLNEIAGIKEEETKSEEQRSTLEPLTPPETPVDNVSVNAPSAVLDKSASESAKKFFESQFARGGFTKKFSRGGFAKKFADGGFSNEELADKLRNMTPEQKAMLEEIMYNQLLDYQSYSDNKKILQEKINKKNSLMTKWFGDQDEDTLYDAEGNATTVEQQLADLENKYSGDRVKSEGSYHIVQGADGKYKVGQLSGKRIKSDDEFEEMKRKYKLLKESSYDQYAFGGFTKRFASGGFSKKFGIGGMFKSLFESDQDKRQRIQEECVAKADKYFDALTDRRHFLLTCWYMLQSDLPESVKADTWEKLSAYISIKRRMITRELYEALSADPEIAKRLEGFEIVDARMLDMSGFADHDSEGNAFDNTNYLKNWGGDTGISVDESLPLEERMKQLDYMIEDAKEDYPDDPEKQKEIIDRIERERQKQIKMDENLKSFASGGLTHLRSKFGKLAKNGFRSLLNFGKKAGKKLGSLAKGAISKGYNWLKGKFATRPTDEVDADGNPIQYGEAGTEAIMPIESKPGNLVDVVGKKIAAILSGREVGPSGDNASTGEASVHAGTESAAPMENKLATELADTIQKHKTENDIEQRFGVGGFLTNMAKTGLTGAATALGGPVGGLLTSSVMNSDLVKKGINTVASGATDLVSKAANVITNPLDKLKDKLLGSKPTESKPLDISGLIKSSSGNGDKLGELLETNKKMYELLVKILMSSDGIKIQGMDGLLQATMASAQNSERGGSPTIIMKNDERKGLDFSKTGSVERQKFNG